MKKKCYSPRAVLLITGCAHQSHRSKQNRSRNEETITYHFFVSGIGRRKPSMQPKFVAAQKNVVKTETQQTFVNGLSFVLL